MAIFIHLLQCPFFSQPQYFKWNAVLALFLVLYVYYIVEMWLDLIFLYMIFSLVRANILKWPDIFWSAGKMFDIIWKINTPCNVYTYLRYLLSFWIFHYEYKVQTVFHTLSIHFTRVCYIKHLLNLAYKWTQV